MSEFTKDIRALKWYKSLLRWINTFENINSKQLISSITDLSDSTLLIDCLEVATPDKTILPDSLLQNDSAIKSLQFGSSIPNHEANFSKILATLSEFFDIPMDQAISLTGLLSGCEHEFTKLLLTFLAYAVQQKPNELIIQRILDLDIEVQVTLGKLIEEMFKKLGSKQIETIRDLVINIDLESSNQPAVEESDDLMITELPDPLETVTPPLIASPDLVTLDNPVIECLSPLFDTPVPVNRSHQDSLFGVTDRYYGFDSPAALKWINQPEIKRSLRRPESSRHTPAKVTELCQLQHKVNQQQEEIHVLRKFCQEKETELIKNLEKLKESELGCRELSVMREKVSDMQDEKVAFYQQAQFLEMENTSLKKEVHALSGYKDRCEHLQDMTDELANTAKGNQMLLLNAEKLQLELISEKDKIFQLETEKYSLEQKVLEQQAASEILGQGKQQLQEELEQVRGSIAQLEGDLDALKKSKVEDIPVDYGEKMSERGDEIALLFKIKLLEEEIDELRKIIPKASERDQLEVELKRVTSDLDTMRRGREELCKRYSETKADALRLEGKLIEFEKYKTQLEVLKETVASLNKENSFLKLEIHSKISSHTTLSTENQRLELCLDQGEREKGMLKRRVTELDTTVLSIQDTYNELFCLKEKLILDNDTMDKELIELRYNKILLQERETRASNELNSIITQRNGEMTRLSSKLSGLQEKNCSMQSEVKSLELKLSSVISELSSKEETIATIKEASKKRELGLKEELETVAKSNSEFQDRIHLSNNEFNSILSELEISKKRFERQTKLLTQETSDFKECKTKLEIKLEHAEEQLSTKVTQLQNTIDSLRTDLLGLARSNQTLQQDKHKLALMVKEYECMQEDNSSTVVEDLNEANNKLSDMEKILDDAECERNTLHSQMRSLNVQLQFAENQLRIEQKKSSTELIRDKKSQHPIERERPNVGRFTSSKQFTGIADVNSSPDPLSEYTSQRTKWGVPTVTVTRSSRIPDHSKPRTPVCSAEPGPSVKYTDQPMEPKNQSLNRTHEIKRRNAQTLPHLKSSYPIEFQTSSLSERYLQSESPNMDPAYEEPKLGSVPNFLSENPTGKKALAFEIDLGSWDDAKANKDRNTDTNRKTVLPPRVLRSNKSKISHSVIQTYTSTIKKRKT